MPRPPKAKKADPPSPDERTTIINLKGSLEYAAFFQDAHEKTHISKAVIVRLALKDWFLKNGLGEPPAL